MASFPFLRDDDLLVVEEIINFRFANRSLLREALQAAALADRDGNKRLAVLGDAAHRLILVVEGHTRNETRGQINSVISMRVSNSHLARQGFLKGLNRYICNNPCQGKYISAVVMATTIEAILGATFLDASR